MIAMAIACRPKLLIADEPTTALDVTIQAQILDLLLELQRETGMALVLITHDMGVVAETAERVAVLLRRPEVRGAGRRRPFRRPASSLHRGVARRASRARRGRRLPAIAGVVPGQCDRPAGCLFSPRCRYATDLCRRDAAAASGPGSRPGALPLPAASVAVPPATLIRSEVAA